MVFNSSIFVLLFFVILVIWLSVISVFLLRMIRHYNVLTRDISDHGLKAILEQILKRQHTGIEKTQALQETLHGVMEDSESHIQKIGLIRFNPFSDTGGSQSFTLSMLDKNDTGIVMTSLYARTGNRWYVKEIIKGKGNGVELSKEELSAIKRAKDRSNV